LNVAPQPGFSSGDKVTVMLRDEVVDILDDPELARHQSISGKITARDFFGASVSYTVTCGDTSIVVSEQSRRLLEVNSNVSLDIPPDRIWMMRE